ncbi:MAG: helicase associated domain-containing protein [Bacteroidota bacterium]
MSEETSLGYDNLRIGILAGTPRIILDNQGYTPFEIDNASGRFRIFNPGVERFTIKSNGNVGIGVNDPGKPLDVKTMSDAGLRIRSVAANNQSGIQFTNSEGTNQWSFIHSKMDNQINIGTISANDFVIKNGNVGIQTEFPDGFEVKSILSVEDSKGSNNIRFGILAGTPRIILDNQGYTPFEIDNASGRFRIFNPGAERFIIKSNGNVGIGVSNPNSKLVVKGTIHSEEVKVEIINGPDYVFESDYDLRTLQETKEYISENKHLPEIPSAKEMQADGVNLGDMNMRLLKKIEELTLYQIELLEKLDLQNEQLQKQQQRIEKLESKWSR